MCIKNRRKDLKTCTGSDTLTERHEKRLLRKVVNVRKDLFQATKFRSGSTIHNLKQVHVVTLIEFKNNNESDDVYSDRSADRRDLSWAWRYSATARAASLNSG